MNNELIRQVRCLLFSEEQVVLANHRKAHSNIFKDSYDKADSLVAPLFGLIPDPITDLLLHRLSNPATKVVAVFVQAELWSYVSSPLGKTKYNTLSSNLCAHFMQKSSDHTYEQSNYYTNDQHISSILDSPQADQTYTEACKFTFRHKKDPQDCPHLLICFLRTEKIQPLYSQPMNCRPGFEERHCLPDQKESDTLKKISSSTSIQQTYAQQTSDITPITNCMIYLLANPKQLPDFVKNHLEPVLLDQVRSLLPLTAAQEVLDRFGKVLTLDSFEVEEIYGLVKLLDPKKYLVTGNILILIFSCIRSLIKERRAFYILKYLIKLLLNANTSTQLLHMLDDQNLSNPAHMIVRTVGSLVTGIDENIFFSERVESLPAFNPKVDTTLALNDMTQVQTPHGTLNDSYQEEFILFESLTIRSQLSTI
jgi:hypothetical protein